MVNWDRGTSANYRIGAHGKYDLYLLADQSKTLLVHTNFLCIRGWGLTSH